MLGDEEDDDDNIDFDALDACVASYQQRVPSLGLQSQHAAQMSKFTRMTMYYVWIVI